MSHDVKELFRNFEAKQLYISSINMEITLLLANSYWWLSILVATTFITVMTLVSRQIFADSRFDHILLRNTFKRQQIDLRFLLLTTVKWHCTDHICAKHDYKGFCKYRHFSSINSVKVAFQTNACFSKVLAPKSLLSY